VIYEWGLIPKRGWVFKFAEIYVFQKLKLERKGTLESLSLGRKI